MRNFKNMNKAEYDEYMSHFNKAYNTFDALMDIAINIDLAKLAYMKDAASLNSNPDISETFRARSLSEINKETLVKLNSHWLTAEKLFAAFVEEMDAITERLDLNDNRLTAAVTLMNAAGAQRGGIGSMPSGSVQSALVEPFGGNYEALVMLRGLADSNGLAGAVIDIDNRIKILESAKQFPTFVAQRMYNATLAANDALMMPDVSPFVNAVCDVYGFNRPEVPEEIHHAAVRVAMGLSAAGASA